MTEDKWKLHWIHCISCGKDMGYMMQKTEKQVYFYCTKCLRVKIEGGIDLEHMYNHELPMEMCD